MKTTLLLIPIIFLFILIGCQSQSDMYGKWIIEDIQTKDTTNNTDCNMAIVGLAFSDFNYYEFTNKNELLLYNSKNEILSKEKYLLSEDGSELLIKGSIDQVFKLDIISDSIIELKDNDCIIILNQK